MQPQNQTIKVYFESRPDRQQVDMYVYNKTSFFTYDSTAQAVIVNEIKEGESSTPFIKLPIELLRPMFHAFQDRMKALGIEIESESRIAGKYEAQSEENQFLRSEISKLLQTFQNT